MTKQMQILGGMLIAQLVLAGWMLTREQTTATFKPTEPLITLNQDQVGHILLEEMDADKLSALEMVKKDGQWVLPATHDFPVSRDKITGFLKTMADFKKSWPAGKTEIAARQFKVTDKAFERRLTFSIGEKKQLLYLGSSPGFKKIHARPDGDQQTYSVSYSAYEASTKHKDWLDQEYLNLERTAVKAVTLAQMELENSGGDFLVTEPGEGMETNRSKTSGLVSSILKPQFNDIAGLKEGMKKGDEILSCLVEKSDKQKVRYTWYQTVAGSEADQKQQDHARDKDSGKQVPSEDLLLLVSDRPFAFKVKRPGIEGLLNLNKADFVKAKAPSEEDGQASSEKKGHPVPNGT